MENLCLAGGRFARRSPTPIATGERLIASYGTRELIDMGAEPDMKEKFGRSGWDFQRCAW
jgi:hypothetical protein